MINLEYMGGHPDGQNRCLMVIRKEYNYIVFINQITGKEKFRINKEDIINIEYRQGNLKVGNANFIVMKVKYNNAQIEVLFNAGLFPTRNYSKFTSLIYSQENSSLVVQSRDLNRINFYEKTWFIILMLIFLAPIGIFLMWKYKRFNQPIRIILSAIFICFFLNRLDSFVVWYSSDLKNAKTISNNTNPTKNSNNSNSSETTPVETTSTRDIPTDTSKKDDFIKEGMYKVGTDLSAGEYVIITNNSEQGYMQITKDSTGTFDSIISNENIANRTYVTVNDAEYLTVKNAKIYPLDKAPKIDTSSGILSDGMYKVGTDLSAGEYKINSPSNGYVEITSSSRHTLDGIISNDNFTGDKYITIQDGQYMKLHNATLTLNN